MKKEDLNKNRKHAGGLIVCLAAIASLMLIMPTDLLAQDSGEKVNHAYQLRMNGKLDDAKVILSQVLEKEPSCAIAWYEMARLQTHAMLGRGKYSPEDILNSYTKAAENNAKNPLYLFSKANALCLKAYTSQSEEDSKTYFMKACQYFDEVLNIDPDNNQALLYLTDLYASLPENLGGDRNAAAKYAGKLEKTGSWEGNVAKTIMMDESADHISYWKDLYNSNKSASNAEYLGKAYIYKEDVENAVKYLKKAITLNPGKKLLQLDIGRIYIYRIMQKKGDMADNYNKAETAFQKFLDDNPEMHKPYKAYALGWMAKLNRINGNPDKAKTLDEKAKQLDPYYSRATAVPSMALYSAPGEEYYKYSSYFKPF